MMRCLSVASAFVRAGHEVKFITADHCGESLIRSRGFETICLDSDWKKMRGDGTDRIVRNYSPDILLVDSYYITENYFSSLRDYVGLAYLDDLNAGTWDIDYLINYNIFGPVMDYSGYDDCRTKRILGPSFAPLRDEFRDMPRHKMEDVERIVVSAGGSDPEGITEKLIQKVCNDLKGIVFHFVVGALNPRLGKIISLANEHKNVVLHINEKNMAGLMRGCDLAISAAGSTLYELCACGTPTITYTLADNQLAAAEEFEKQSIMISAGDCRENRGFIDSLADKINRMISDKGKREQFSTRMQSLVDGYGADRLAGEIVKQV